MPAEMRFSSLICSILTLIAVIAAGCDSASDQLNDEWSLPVRPSEAATGSELAAAWTDLSLEDREALLVQEFLSGNVPDWLRHIRFLSLEKPRGGDWVTLEIGVLPDYLAVGSSADFLYMPMTPQAAQRIADATEMMLPTPFLVDAIWQQAEDRVDPRPIPPSPAMTTMPVFVQHHSMLASQRDSLGLQAGTWMAGHKKDVVLSGRLNETDSRVAIYGWHRPGGTPIQPVYTGHTDRWVDYSHGIRLVSRFIRVDGKVRNLTELLTDGETSSWFLDDGPLDEASYPY